MKAKIIIVLLFMAVCYSPLPSAQRGQLLSYDRKEIEAQIKELCGTDYGREFLSGRSLEELEKVILFLQDPPRYYDEVQKIGGLRSYIMIYEHYLRETGRYSGFIFPAFLYKHFKTIDNRGVEILTYLLLNCSQGIYGEFLSEKYINLFESSPRVFVKDLKQRKDWKDIIDELIPGPWDRFVASVKKLGDSSFENELRTYVAERNKDRLHPGPVASFI